MRVAIRDDTRVPVCMSLSLPRIHSPTSKIDQTTLVPDGTVNRIALG